MDWDASSFRVRIRSAPSGPSGSDSWAPSWAVSIGGLLGIGLFTIVFEVAVAAGLVYLVSGRSHRLPSGGR